MAHHETITTRHLSINKTKELIQCNYYWVNLHNYIKKYMEGCLVCPTIKPIQELPIGELQQTQIPSRPWEIITMDFIGLLSESRGSNAILNVMDKHSNLLYLLPCNDTITAEGVACLFQWEIWPHEGLPEKVISDQGPQFMAQFTQELYKLLHIKGVPSTAYHPQTDGQTEHLNQELKIYL